MGILTDAVANGLANTARKAYEAGQPIFVCQMTEKVGAVQLTIELPNLAANIAGIESVGWRLDRFEVAPRKDQPVAFCLFRR